MFDPMYINTWIIFFYFLMPYILVALKWAKLYEWKKKWFNFAGAQYNSKTMDLICVMLHNSAANSFKFYTTVLKQTI